jgi:AcrR family transcriptional regulator
LFRLASPLLRGLGYQDVSLKQLAAACGLSIPALYRYFPSKRELALFPLTPANRPPLTCFTEPRADPLVVLSRWIDIACVDLPDLLLGLGVASGLPGDAVARELRDGCIDHHRVLLRALVGEVRPELGGETVGDIVESLIGVLLSPLFAPTQNDLHRARERATSLLRGYLAPVVGDARFDQAFRLAGAGR